MKLFSRISGSGHPLIILHGLYGSSDNWVTIAKLLSGKFEVHLIDQRNHGKSPHSDEHNYSLMKNDLLIYLNDHDITQAILAGHSMGGKTVMYFAMDYPERLSSLIVIDILPVSYKEDVVKRFENQQIIGSMLTMDLNSISSREEAEQLLAADIPQKKISGFLLKNLQRNRDGSFSWKINIRALHKHLEEILEGPDLARFEHGRGITGFPVLFIRGAESDYIPPDSFALIKKIFPFAEIVTIPGAGHWLHAEQPNLLAGTIIYFTGQ